MNHEPTFTLVSDRIGLINGLNFYSQNHDLADSKKWALDWLKKNHPELAKKLAEVKYYRFSNRGFLCRMMERGYNFSPEQNAALLKFFQDLAKQEKIQEVEQKPTPQDKRPAHKINPCMQSLDDVIEAAAGGKTPPKLVLNDKKADVQEVVDYCNKIIAEMTDYKEYYSPKMIANLGPVLRKCREQGLGVIKALESKKTIIATPKKINPIAMAKNVRYQKEDKTLGIKSAAITSVIGARKLYAYDTKARKLRCYVSNSAQGFMFSGTTLKNFDPDKSICKTIRKPEEFFSKFKDGITMSALNKAFKALTTVESKIWSGGRFNENLIVLKVAAE